MQGKIISIIVPVYNSEMQIKRTIESIISQTYTSIEIILVNDGSTDNSLNVMEDYLKNDKRIKIINKSNGGVSSARNTGIKEASGEYIAFVDADDYIEKNYIERLYEIAKHYNADIVKCMYKKNGKEVKLFKEESLYNLDIKDDLEKIQKGFMESFNFNQVWAQLIKKEIIKNNFFDEELKMGEDYVFNYFLYKNSKKIFIIPECLYNYSINENGMAHSLEPHKIKRKIKDILLIYEKIYNGQPLFVVRSIKELIPHLLMALISKKISNKEKKEIFDNIVNHQIIKDARKKINLNEFKNYKYKLIVKCIYTNNYKLTYIYANSVYKIVKEMKKILGDKI